MPNRRIRAIQSENSKKVAEEDGLPLIRPRRQYKVIDTTPFQYCRPNRAERWTDEPQRLKTRY